MPVGNRLKPISTIEYSTSPSSTTYWFNLFVSSYFVLGLLMPVKKYKWKLARVNQVLTAEFRFN